MPESPPEKSSNETPPAPVLSQRSDRALFVIVTIILGVIALMMAGSFAFQYGATRDFAAQAARGPKPDPVLALTALRFAEASLLRISTFFLSFVLIYVGALYVLRSAQTSYSASVEGGGIKTAFQATSPGLVLATLGVGLVLVATFKTNGIAYNTDASSVNFSPQLVDPPIDLKPDKK
jgi:hypothetical protein